MYTADQRSNYSDINPLLCNRDHNPKQMINDIISDRLGFRYLEFKNKHRYCLTLFLPLVLLPPTLRDSFFFSVEICMRRWETVRLSVRARRQGYPLSRHPCIILQYTIFSWAALYTLSFLLPSGLRWFNRWANSSMKTNQKKRINRQHRYLHKTHEY